jgi:hypothetical protein
VHPSDWSNAVDNYGGWGGFGIVFWVCWLAFMVLMIAAVWKVFEKAGKPGWAAIIPIYNIIVILEIAGKPLWWILLYLIPLVNIVVGFMVLSTFVRKYGKGIGFLLGLIFLPFIFWPVLGFGDATYNAAA